MATLNPLAHALLARQHGVASTRQLLDTGISVRRLQRLQHEGSLDLVLRGAYRTPSAPLTEPARCAAVCSARPDVAIAGPTAGRLWGFRRLPSDQRIHVLAPPASNPAIARWVVPYRTAARHDRRHHRTRRWHPGHVSTANGARPRPVARARRPSLGDRAGSARRSTRRRRLPRSGRRLAVAPASMGCGPSFRHSTVDCPAAPPNHIPRSEWPTHWSAPG